MAGPSIIALHTPSAFEELFKYYFRPLCYFAMRFLSDADLAQDIVQDAFEKLWDKRDELSFEHEDILKSYLYASVRNKSLSYIEKHSNRLRILENSYAPSLDDHENLEIETEVIHAIYKAIDELPPACGKIFRLSYLQHYSVKEIAEELDVSENTVKTQRKRAKQLLQGKLKSHYAVMLLLFLN